MSHGKTPYTHRSSCPCMETRYTGVVTRNRHTYAMDNSLKSPTHLTGRLVLNLALTTPLVPWARQTLPQTTRYLVPFLGVFACCKRTRKKERIIKHNKHVRPPEQTVRTRQPIRAYAWVGPVVRSSCPPPPGPRNKCKTH